MNLRRMFNIALLSIKASLRDPYYIFWNLIAPVIMFLIFVNMFAPTTGTAPIKLYVYNLDNSTISKKFISLLDKMGINVHVIYAKNLNNALSKVISSSVTHGCYPRLLVIPRGFGENITEKSRVVLFLYALKEDWEAFIVSQIVNKCIKNLMGIRNVSRHFSYIVFKQIKTSYMHALQELAVGILISALLIAWLIGGVGNTISLFAHFKSTGYIKRLKVANVKPHELFLSLSIGTLLVYVVTTILILLASYITRGVVIKGLIPCLITSLALVIMIFFGASIGLIIGVLAKIVEPAIPMAISIALLLMFISGYAIPLTLLPETFKQIALLLPTTYILLALKAAIIYSQYLQALKLLTYPTAATTILSIVTTLLIKKKI